MTKQQIIDHTVTTPTTNELAVISLVMSLLGFLIPIVPQIGGIICGHIARSEIRQSGGTQTGSGIALAGLVISYLSISIFCIFVLVSLVFFGFGLLALLCQ